jgi:fructokinase
MKSVAFGEVLWDIIEGKPHLGGAPLNFAAHLSKAGAESHIISKIGNDELGTAALQQIQLLGVHTGLISVDSQHETGTVDVFLKNGQPDYKINTDVAYDYIEEAEELATFPEVHLFYFGTLIQRNEMSRKALYRILDFNKFEFTFYDVNLRKDCYDKEVIHRSLQYANIIKLNKGEVKTIGELLFKKNMSSDEFLKETDRQYKPKIVIITDGGNGCFIHQNGFTTHVPGVEADVKDAIGAGDSFSAAFMYKYFRTRDALVSARVANVVGAFVASNHGAIPVYSEQVKAVLMG